MLYDIFGVDIIYVFTALKCIHLYNQDMVSLFIIVRRKCGHLMTFYAVHP